MIFNCFNIEVSGVRTWSMVILMNLSRKNGVILLLLQIYKNKYVEFFVDEHWKLRSLHEINNFENTVTLIGHNTLISHIGIQVVHNCIVFYAFFDSSNDQIYMYIWNTTSC